jgi:histidyl-tRNA synthetase
MGHGPEVLAQPVIIRGFASFTVNRRWVTSRKFKHMSKVQSVRGMNDVLPDQAALWEFLEDTCRRVFRSYGYANMRTPIVEMTPLFVRAIGEVTDVVEKEMYSFADKLNGDPLTLRPEATAGLVRAAIEHNLTYNGPVRVWTQGPMFRHERPQKGRYRQFHQFDVEAFGFAGPDVDAEQMLMLARLFRELGLVDVTLQINSIGDREDRARHRAALIDYLEANQAQLDEDAKRRLHSNPLRVLDSKTESMQALLDGAPRLIDFIDQPARLHFDALTRRLTDAGLAFEINPRLVRGLDYYNRSVFEFVTRQLGSPLTIAAGGRYDGLFEQLGGKPTPGIGFGMGVERVILLLEANASSPVKSPLDVVLAYADETQAEAAARLAEPLRDAGLCVLLSHGGSLKSQFKRADQSGAAFVIVIGAEELATGTVTLKRLQSGEQWRLPLDEAIARIKA